MLKLTVISEGMTEKGVVLSVGQTVEYLGHVPGGNISIRLSNGDKDVANCFRFKEFQ